MSLKAAILALLGARPSPAARRRLAAELRQLADEQERLADAQERLGPTRAAGQADAQNANRPRGGRPKGSGGQFVRYDPPSGKRIGGGHLFISASLYAAIGEPDRLDVQMLSGALHLRPAAGGDGYAVTRNHGARGGLARIGIGVSTAEDWGLVEGVRMAAEVRDGAIVVG